MTGQLVRDITGRVPDGHTPPLRGVSGPGVRRVCPTVARDGRFPLEMERRIRHPDEQSSSCAPMTPTSAATAVAVPEPPGELAGPASHDGDSHPVRFSPAQIEELRAVLAPLPLEPAAIIDAVARRLSTCAGRVECDRAFGADVMKIRRRHRQARAALLRVASHLDAARELGDVSTVTQEARYHVRSACRRLDERLEALQGRIRRGRHPDQARDAVALTVVRALLRSGVPVARTRRGAAARVLGIALEAAGQYRPVDLRPVLERALVTANGAFRRRGSKSEETGSNCSI